MSIFTGKVLLITGGTGSFGNAVLNRFLSTDINEILVFSRNEKTGLSELPFTVLKQFLLTRTWGTEYHSHVSSTKWYYKYHIKGEQRG